MIESDILKKLQTTSIEERILIIEAILKPVKNDMRSTSLPQLASEHPLGGKIIRYDEPYEPVAVEDWEAIV